MLFSRIEDAVLSGEVDMGVIIHENRFTYTQKGLIKIADLGEVWEQKEKAPIPLGCIAANKRLPADVQAKVDRLMMDDDVTNKKGIFDYVLTGNESKLSIRQFTDAQKMAAYTRQQGICPKCGKHFEFEEMEGDHITPWSQGGHTTPDNLQMLCKNCNRLKSDK